MNREQAQGKWHLPKPLQVTAENLERIERANAELAARVASPYARLSPQEQERARAAALITELAEQLRLVNKRLGKVFTAAGADHFDELLTTQRSLWRQLAEAHASTGRFDLAAHYTDTDTADDRRQKAEYLRIWRAVWRDDAHFCSCPPTRGSGQRADVTAPSYFVRKDIYSVKHDRVLPLLKCGRCHCLNVTTRKDVLAPIVAQRAHRARAQELVAGLSPAEAAARLRAMSHTSEVLLK